MEPVSVAVGADGRFMVGWTSQNGQDGSYAGVFAQAFDGAGAPGPHLGPAQGLEEGDRVSAVLFRRGDEIVEIARADGHHGDVVVDLRRGQLDQQTVTDQGWALGDEITVLTLEGPSTVTLVGTATYGALDGIPGLGAVRRKQLLKHFGSVKQVRAASLEDLYAVPSLPKKVAEAVHEALGAEKAAS